MELLAILGRGIQAINSTCSLDMLENWVSTDDLEMCNVDGSHLARPLPIYDESTHCLIGGGKLNVLAGSLLYARIKPSIVVCAHGHRAPYLQEVNGPSESEVMAHEFRQLVGISGFDSNLFVWDRFLVLPVRSNTAQELRNVFDLAHESSCTTVHIVTVGVHLPRAMMIAQRLQAEQKFWRLNVRFHESESIVSASVYGDERSARIRASRALMRSWTRETNGIRHLMLGTY